MLNMRTDAGSTRRQFMRAMVAASGLALPGCGRHVASELFPGTFSEFRKVTDLPDPANQLPTWQIGPETGAGVLLMHELPGLTKDDLALARALARRNFHVFVPLLFGRPEQDNVPLGFVQACTGKDPFNCSESKHSPILSRLANLSEAIAQRKTKSTDQGTKTIGAIGMCLTGILPLALLNKGVGAAVLCQPTIPFNALHMKPSGDQIRQLGLGDADLDNSRHSPVPFLLLHYLGDELCPKERVDEIRKTFKNRVATIDLPNTHHSSLASDFDRPAFEDVVAYLNVRMGVEAAPRRMALAKLGEQGQSCSIGADGWLPQSR